jgi:hypothetical protein
MIVDCEWPEAVLDIVELALLVIMTQGVIT